MTTVNVAVVGATGLVGSNILAIMEERDFPVDNLYLYGSANSAGSTITYKGNDYEVRELNDSILEEDIDIALFAAGGKRSEQYGKLAAQKGIRVVDNSSFFRMDPEVKLVVPEINGDTLTEEDYLVANPNCSTIQSVLPLKPVLDSYGLERVIYTTYQSVSGSGVAGIRDLDENLTENYPYHITGNVLPHIDSFADNGYTLEELKMVDETHKIFGDDSIKISATTVRVPVRYGHSVAINAELKEDYNLDELREKIAQYPGIELRDDVENNIYPMPLDAAGKDPVYVGRIREDLAFDNGVTFFSVADNTRKGAALNAVQIAEELVKFVK